MEGSLRPLVTDASGHLVDSGCNRRETWGAACQRIGRHKQPNAPCNRADRKCGRKHPLHGAIVRARGEGQESAVSDPRLGAARWNYRWGAGNDWLLRTASAV
jgi:hypothetical protein